MTNYVKSTNFATKDTLTSGDPLKIVKGTEINTEFDNIATAVATKADLLSPTFTGTPTLPTGTTGVTQSYGDNTTKLSTTAFVQAALVLIYPIGSIYTATVSTNPATLFGFGTWTAFGAGRVLIGNGGGFTAGATGGSADAIVVSHTHTFSATTGTTSLTGTFQASKPASASGIVSVQSTGLAGGADGSQVSATQYAISASHSHSVSGTTDSTGASATNANLQPYIVVYMWQRTA
jgi:ligand-binding SRPBCC domain-containing protein